MAASGSKRGRIRDAKLAREMILGAAEAIFAERGFDGAHVDAIAKASGYNISLLFQYFGDKLGLYAAVLERLHRETTELQAQVFGPWLADEGHATHRQEFSTILETAVRTVFDYLVAHPRFLRILTWEMAQGWQTYTQIASQFPTEESAQLEVFFQGAWKAGWLRSDCSALIQLTLVFQVCQSYLNVLPLFQVVLPGEDLSSEQARSRMREHIVGFIVAGMLSDPQSPNA